MTTHSRVGASSMYRWSKCPGSVRLCAVVPPTSSVYADEGTKAHELAAKWLLEPHNAEALLRVMPAEMIDAVRVYVDYVLAKEPSTVQLIEHKFHLKAVHPACFGTADAVLWSPDTKTLETVDYKHGAGVPVEVKGNPQLRYYALGALLELGVPAKTVVSTIVQPRCVHPDGPIRSETYTAFDLLDWAADLVTYVEETEKPDAALVPGNHCRFCPAAAVCPALQAHSLQLAKAEFGPVTAYDPEKLAEALRLADHAEAWAKAVREFAYAEATRGREPPGFKLVAKRATRKWVDESLVEAALQKNGLAAADIHEAPALKSPAQIEKLIGKKAFGSFEAEYVVKESTGNALVPVTDPRPAVRVFDAAAEFPALKQETDQ